MNTLKKMFLFITGQWKPREEIHEVKNEITKIVLKPTITGKKVNQILYKEDTAYFLAKAMGVKLHV